MFPATPTPERIHDDETPRESCDARRPGGREPAQLAIAKMDTTDCDRCDQRQGTQYAKACQWHGESPAVGQAPPLESSCHHVNALRALAMQGGGGTGERRPGAMYERRERRVEDIPFGVAQLHATTQRYRRCHSRCTRDNTVAVVTDGRSTGRLTIDRCAAGDAPDASEATTSPANPPR
jgi:hypothetical protein